MAYNSDGTFTIDEPNEIQQRIIDVANEQIQPTTPFDLLNFRNTNIYKVTYPIKEESINLQELLSVFNTNLLEQVKDKNYRLTKAYNTTANGVSEAILSLDFVQDVYFLTETDGCTIFVALSSTDSENIALLEETITNSRPLGVFLKGTTSTSGVVSVNGQSEALAYTVAESKNLILSIEYSLDPRQQQPVDIEATIKSFVLDNFSNNYSLGAGLYEQDLIDDTRKYIGKWSVAFSYDSETPQDSLGELPRYYFSLSEDDITVTLI